MEDKLILLRRMFCCGISPRKFNKHFLELDNSEQQRLIKVAERMQLSYVIRYDLSFFSPPGVGDDYDYHMEHIQLSSLEVYLLITCLDTLSGKPHYSTVDQYFEDALDDDKSYSKVDISEKLNDYREIYGTRRTIKQEFQNLSDAHKEWVFQNVAFLKMNDISDHNIRNQDKNILLNRLFKYFYDGRRIEYTHESKTRPTNINRNPKEKLDGWSLSTSSWNDMPDNKRYNGKLFWYRTGLDEATILRLILHGVVLRKLNLKADITIVEAYLMNERRRKTITEFIREIELNSVQLSWLNTFNIENKSSDLISFIYRAGIPKLHREWAENFSKILCDVNFERGYKDTINNYLHAIEFLNSEIEKFNEKNQPGEQTWEEKLVSIKIFTNQILTTEEYNSVIKISDRGKIGNLLLIRRDPCYT